MRLAALTILACVIASPACASQKSDEEAAKALIACAPKTYEAALNCLDTNLSSDMKEQLRQPDGTVQAHFGLGTFLRNNWGLWQGGDLASSMNQLGFTHPDDMSSTILDGYAARLRGQPYDLAAKASEYRAYWTQAAKGEGAMQQSCRTGKRVPVGDGRIAVCEKINGTNIMHFEAQEK